MSMTLEDQREIPENVPIPSIVGHDSPSYENTEKTHGNHVQYGVEVLLGTLQDDITQHGLVVLDPFFQPLKTYPSRFPFRGRVETRLPDGGTIFT